MRVRRRLSASLASVAAALAVCASGCFGKLQVSGDIHAARQASGALDTIGDYELARAATQASLLRYEELHRLAPDSEDALLLLTKGWTAYARGFVEDEADTARLAGDEAAADYHDKRAKLAYDRAIAYGLELLGKKDDAFNEVRKRADLLGAWLKLHFKATEDGEALYWLGAAWARRAELLKRESEAAGDVDVAGALLERSRELAPSFMAWGATTALGAHLARSRGSTLGPALRTDSGGQLESAKKLLDLALDKTHSAALEVQLAYATSYACAKRDPTLYEKMLNEVLAKEDPEPNLRLQNAIAKRRARRALSKAAMSACFVTSSPPK